MDMEEAAGDETDTVATAAEEQQQCSDWLLRIEENLRDGSLTLQALRWALSYLSSSSQKPKKKNQKTSWKYQKNDGEFPSARDRSSIDDVKRDLVSEPCLTNEHGDASPLCAGSVRRGNVESGKFTESFHFRYGGDAGVDPKKDRGENVDNLNTEDDVG